MKNINNIKTLIIEDDKNLYTTLKNYGVDYILDSKIAYEKISLGWEDFDIIIIRPEMMSTVAKYSKLLGTIGKMPCPKCGTVVEESHLLHAILTIKSISKEMKPSKHSNEEYSYINSLYRYQLRRDTIKFNDTIILEYNPLAKFLRQQIARTILNSDSSVSINHQTNSNNKNHHDRFHKPNYGVKSRKPLEDDIDLSFHKPNYGVKSRNPLEDDIDLLI